jgi:hypothetical protein
MTGENGMVSTAVLVVRSGQWRRDARFGDRDRNRGCDRRRFLCNKRSVIRQQYPETLPMMVGIYHQTTLTIENSTISGNTGVVQCGGTSTKNSLIVETPYYLESGDFRRYLYPNLNIGSTIVSGNSASHWDPGRNIGTVSAGFNLIGDWWAIGRY